MSWPILHNMLHNSYLIWHIWLLYIDFWFWFKWKKWAAFILAILCLFQSHDIINLIIYHYWKIFCLKLDKNICYIGHLEISINVLLVSYDFSFQRWHICLTSIGTKFWKERNFLVNLSHYWKFASTYIEMTSFSFWLTGSSLVA